MESTDTEFGSPAIVATTKKRIAIISHGHPTVAKGGGEVAAYALFQGFRKLGYECFFIASCPEWSRSKVFLASRYEKAIFYDPAIYDWFYNIGSPVLLKQLRQILIEEEIEIVNFQHFLNMGVGAIRSIAGDPKFTTVVTLHEYLAICHHHGQMITNPHQKLCEASSPQACQTCFPQFTQQQFSLRKKFLLGAFQNVRAFVAPSHFLAERFAAWGLPKNDIKVIENGLPNDIVKAPPRPRRANSQWIFGYFGQINPFKGVEVLLRMAEIIGGTPHIAGRVQIRIHGNIIGQSEAFQSRFEDIVRRYDFLSYEGAYDNANVSRLMAECDYVIVPSTWWENSPVVIQEAFATGRPVICSGIGGMAEKVQDNLYGVHFRVGDHVDLTHVIDKAANPEVHSHLTAKLPKVSTNVDAARAYDALFDDILHPMTDREEMPTLEIYSSSAEDAIPSAD